ncbi:ROK family protein [Phreatobacter sp.]|uniref:ROK family protein n=1 Tax=Phreatobacter sp. TaxID=1966341 RepID=UPI003F72E81E
MAKGGAGAEAVMPDPMIRQGVLNLHAVHVTSYNLELRDEDGFIGDKASRGAFSEGLDAWRRRLRKIDADPIGDVGTEDLSKSQIDKLMESDDVEAAALIHGAIEAFSQDLAEVIRRYRRTKGWKPVERIVAGGGFRESRVGELAFARTALLLKADGIDIDIVPISSHPDEAGLIGSAYLVPHPILAGHDALLAVDIGGTNIRAGIVRYKMKKDTASLKAKVCHSELWRHADDAPSRTEAVKTLAGMLEDLIARAKKKELKLCPAIGIACPGMIGEDGAIHSGGQNLPGGNWESEHFNLPAALEKAVPEIDGQQTVVVMHNDAVVQGLSELPAMKDVDHWAVLTIGTGLGNASFRNWSAED